jgi:cation-transporting ATPase 13A1
MKYNFSLLNEISPQVRVYGLWFVPMHALLFARVEVTSDGDYEHIIPLLLCLLIHVGLYLGSRWSNKWRRALDMRNCYNINSASHVEVRNTQSGGIIGIFPLCKGGSNSYYIERKCKRMYYNAQTCTFDKIRVSIDSPISAYIQKTQCGLSKAQADASVPNLMEIPIPGFFDLFREHVIEPFFVFQMFCVLLWLLDEYWNYALLTLMMLILLEAQMVKRRIKDLTELRNMKPPTQKVRVKRDGVFITQTSENLVIGDSIQLTTTSSSETLIPADILLTSGSVLVNESMLTGESVPVLKQAIVPSDSKLDINGSHRHSILFAGSTIVSCQSTSTGVVLRTGFNTSQGKLIRTILFASHRVSASSREAYKFIFLLFSVAVLAASFVLYEGLNDRPSPRRPFKLFLSISHILTSVIPPEFPITMSLTVTLSLVHLIRNQIFCTEPFRIPFAGRLKTCCFDKTGTLTSTDMIFEKLAMTKNIDQCQLVLSACNSLVWAGDRLVGDPIEIAAYTGCCVPRGWTLKNDSTCTNKTEVWNIETRFAFDPTLQRMSVIATKSGSSLVLCKGSPESIRGLLTHVPPDYDKQCAVIASQGFRVIAMAVRVKNSDSIPLRETVETRQTFEFSGFACFSYSIKPWTIRSIDSLSSSGHRCVMITGDHLLTAIHVAKQVRIIQNDHFEIFQSLDNFLGDKPLCVEGDPSAVITAGQADRVSVWARATPAHKKKIVEALSRGDDLCLFCGDGTNDVAALKQAAVGIAVMSSTSQDTSGSAVVKKLKNSGIVSDVSSLPSRPGDASIAAPFTYKGDTIRCVPLLVRSGRAALALIIQMYKILAVNSLITAFCLSVLTLKGIKLGDTQTAIEALVMSVISFMFSRFPPSKNLPQETFKPVYSVFQTSVVVSIFAQAGLHLILLAYGQFGLSRIVDTNVDEKFEPSLANTVAFLQLSAAHLSSMIANFEGPPSLPSIFASRPVMVLVLLVTTCLVLFASGLLPGDMIELVHIEPSMGMEIVQLVIAHLLGGVGIGYSIRIFFERP